MGAGSVRIEYDPHALRRMSERRISRVEVEKTLLAYETELPAKAGRRNRYKVISGRRIRVTFDGQARERYYVWTVTADEVSK